jgi:hypothetical protein
MENEELLKKIQAVADETAKNYVKPAKCVLIHQEVLENGVTEALVLSSDMPLLVYRVFELDAEGNVTENKDIKHAIERTRHYNEVIKPTLKLVPPEIEEQNEYEIIVENKLDTGGVEVKLRSTVGRDVTMIEIYRYFDYVSRIFFVSCVSTSFGGQYLFSVTPDSKHFRMILGNQPEVRARVDMMTELLQARLLPSYQTVDAASKLLNGEVKAHIELNAQDGSKVGFDNTFCYDDPETQCRYSFFVQTADNKQGIILVQDVLDNNKLILPQNWSEEQKAAAERIKDQMTTNREEFQKHVVNFFADDLDFRYNAFKAGKLKPTAPAAPAEPAPEAK